MDRRAASRGGRGAELPKETGEAMEAEEPPLDGDLRCAGGTRRAGGRRGGRPSKFCRFSRRSSLCVGLPASRDAPRSRKLAPTHCGGAASAAAFARTLELFAGTASPPPPGPWRRRRKFQRSRSPTTRRAAAPRSSRSRTCSSTSSAAARPRRCRPSARPASRHRRAAPRCPTFATLDLRLVSREWNQAALAQIGAAHTAVQLRSVEGAPACPASCQSNSWRYASGDARARDADPTPGSRGCSRRRRAGARSSARSRCRRTWSQSPPDLPCRRASRCSTSRRRRPKNHGLEVDVGAAASATPPGCASSA